MKKLILLCGKRASGKSLFKEVATTHSLPFFEMSDVVFNMMREQSIPINSESTAQFAKSLRKKEGEAAVAKHLLPLLEETNASFIIVSGLRSVEELNLFKSEYNAILVEVRAKDELRFRRSLDRARPSDPKTLDEFLAREKAEAALGVEELIKMADIIIENNDMKEDFYKKIEDFFAFLEI